jgi:hypothetical protein
MNDSNKQFEAPAVIISVALIICALIAAYAALKIRNAGNVIAVTGSAEKIVTSDTAKWTSNLSRSTDASGLKYGSAQIKQDAEVAKKYFTSQGIKPEEITVQPPTISPVCESQNNTIYDKFGNQNCGSGAPKGWSLQQVMTIESSDVKKVADLSQKAGDALVSQGLVFSSQNLEYYYSKLGDLRLELLSSATKNAKERADQIAKSTGGKIGTVQSSSMGVFQVTAKNSVDVSDYGSYDTSALEKKVTAVVRASFLIR